MRPSHQNSNNKRMRGRNRSGGGGGGGGGKGPNPLSRSYESNGPDVKIRGTAQHIAEKYLQLGRDAQASGDPVAAESYWQHAEHYLRLIAAAQEQYRQQNPSYRPYEPVQDQDDDDMDEGSPYPAASQGQPEPRFPQQPQGEGDEQPQQRFQPREPREQREFQPRQQREQREFQPRQPREQRDYQPREGEQPREDREMGPRGEGFGRRDDRFPRRPRFERQDGPRPEFPRNDPSRLEQPRLEQPRGEQPRAAESVEASLPAFITAPVRAPASVEAEPVAPAPAAEETGTFPLRARRRRKPRADEAAPIPDDAPAGE